MAVSVALFSDPGCPWGYSADRCEAALRWRYGDQLDWELVMIGLAVGIGMAIIALKALLK